MSFQAFTATLRPDGLTAPAFASRATGAVLQPTLAGTEGERILCFTESAGFGRYRISVTGTGTAFRRYNRLAPADLWEALTGTALGLFSFFLALYYIPATVLLTVAVVTVISAVALTWVEHHDRAVMNLGLASYLIGKTLLLRRTFYEVTVRSLLPAWLAPLPVGWLISTAFFALGVWAAVSLRQDRRLSSSYAGILAVAAVDLPLTWLLFTPYLR
ncbi:MAG: hypothetical protein QME79_10395 [Bacillota bacterium]|nr:hypothetical protein [Bacillota bacterium]